MPNIITQRELRNDSGAIMRALDDGEDFIVTRNGVPVGELHPVQRRFATRARFLAAFENAAPVDAERFRADVDDPVDQGIEPRA